MPRIYALDTNAVIFYVTDEKKACERLIPIIQDSDTRLIIPAIVVAELWAAPYEALGQIDAIRALLGTAIVAPLDEALAQSAGVIQRQCRMRLGDACVAATAIAHGAPLLTRDEDFRRVPNLWVEVI